MAFEPHKISFDNGVRQDLNNIDADRPSMLSSATNVMYTTKGSIIGRYGVDSQNGRVQKINNSGGAVVQDGTNLSAAVLNKIHAGIEASDNQIFALYQGDSFIRTSQKYNGSNAWRQTGPFWSIKRYNSSILDNRNVVGSVITSPVAIGTNLVGIPANLSSSTGLAVIGNNRFDLVDTQALSNYDSVSQFNQCITTLNSIDYIFYPKADGSLYMHIVDPINIPGSGTEVQLVAPGNVDTGLRQTIWATSGPTELFVAYVNTAQTNIIVLRVTIVGAVTASITLTGGSNILGVSLCHNGGVTGSGGKMCVGWEDRNTSNRYRTKILNCVSSVSITDAALDVNHGSGLAGTNALLYRGHSVGVTSAGTIAVAFSHGNTATSTRLLQIDIRTFTNTTTFICYTLKDCFDNIPTSIVKGIEWRVLTPAATFCGKTVISVYKETNNGTSSGGGNISGQWFVLDISNNIAAANSGPLFLVAAGTKGKSFITPPINPTITISTTTRDNIYSIGVVDNIEFSFDGIITAGGRLVRLQATGAKSVLVNGISMFSGASPYTYDGLQMTPTGFIEDSPVISGSTILAGGALPSTNTASLQAIWQITNGKGQIIRSAQSNIITVTGTPGNGKFDIQVSVPQLSGRYLFTAANVFIKLYSTEFNPSSGAPLYLINSRVITIGSGITTAGFVTFTNVLVTVPSTADEQLYTGGNIFDDQTPESADRGITFVNNRIWVADQDRVYVSKILSRQFAPAFNSNSGKLIIEMPTSIGEIQSLGTLEDKVAVIGSFGTAIIYGPGFDDLGNGPGWAVQTTPGTGAYVDSLINQTGPRISCNVPNVGVAFAGPNTDLYIMNNGGQVQVLTRALKDDVRPVSDVLFVDAGKSTIAHGPMLLMVSGDGSGFIKYYDIESGRVSQWSLGTITSFCTSLNGDIFRQGFDAAVGISSLTEVTGQDLNIPFGQTIVTGNVSITGAVDNALSNAWGRLRSVNVLHDNAAQYTLSIQVVADRSDVAIIDKSINVIPEFNQKWPYSQFEEFRTTTQRCSTFIVTLNAVPATAEWAGIEFWSSVNADRAPSRNRR